MIHIKWYQHVLCILALLLTISVIAACAPLTEIASSPPTVEPPTPEPSRYVPPARVRATRTRSTSGRTARSRRRRSQRSRVPRATITPNDQPDEPSNGGVASTNPRPQPTYPAGRTIPSNDRNLVLGNPSGAVHDPADQDNYLIERPQYALSYNRSHSTANWVSWQVTSSDLGPVKRSNMFVPDTTLPNGWYEVTLNDYTGSGYDRGHMCPSGDRTATTRDNQATFILTNVIPQAPDNNRSTWEHLESFSRDLVMRGHVLDIIAGGDGENGTVANGKIVVPRYTWKIVVVLPQGANDTSRITAGTPVIAVRVPNALNETLSDWDSYRVSVATIEAATGYHFFTNLPATIQQALKSHIDPVPTS